LDKRKKHYLLIDVETTNGFKTPMVYDVGIAITDKKGVIYEEKSFLIDETFNNSRMMDTAYYKEKIPSYRKELEEGKHQLVKWNFATSEINRIAKKWQIKKVAAYNLAFDKNAMASTNELIGNGKKVLSGLGKIEGVCIWGLACQTIFLQKTYQTVAIENGWVSEAGNLRTSAEMAYRYITNDTHFEEEHKGLADVRIEAEIMAHCLRQNKRYIKGIVSHPWRIPNKC